ncbi:4-amino-4-deoxy-L-arabinose transferase [Streptoalloteichus tenebrarius]|uniref:4-amino-4-deoxy-L-arabinose transferase n=1 Tax=Streptoalloteichus tenebrarius (strain ATCC 17920 / DSM 40477 / JCM 4838 / CBS 697.72 / NBRC 16177 / NCIMB 11028 / NRRL B-12390 / A12253. 1 / ISP 5477) TaxID=1933 RepID=A0ABT1HLQ8_STRSD|nr:glycosyltransferase family 39 protein [Streptoalloteichus tenebrarius]MCP2256435.1 4-amino-4-deoxy-L-arabinose transferase [Streptoalloteichus tenebrarius]BFF04787.1 glycosyltransferase family 39 protein [Streptoalloteichus tenebrarius]
MTASATIEAADRTDEDGVPALRAGPVLVVAGVLGALLLATAGRHGYYMDELYFRVAGRHLAFGYVDQPPLAPLLARAQIAVFGDSVFALRVVPALLAVASVVVAALVVRELGGGGRAQVLAALATSASLATLAAGHVLHPTAVDHLVWVTVCWLVVRLVRTGDTRLWLAVGAVVGVGLLAKYLVALLVVTLLVGLVLCGPRRVLRSGHLLGGVVLGLVVAGPGIVWQARNGWPQFTMASEMSAGFGVEGAVGFLVGQPLMIGLFLTPLWIAGLVALFRRPQWRPYRSLAVAYLLMVVLLTVVGGFSRYSEGLLTVLLAVGCVPAVDWARGVGRRALLGAAVLLNAVTSAVMCLPVLPATAYGEDSPLAGFADAQLGQTGWAELTEQVAAVYRSLPEGDRARAVLLGQNYSEAGALDRYGPGLDLPAVYSGHNSYADFGVPSDDRTVVVAVGVDVATLRPLFGRCETRATLSFPLPHLDQGKEVVVCHDPNRPWDQIWPSLRWIGTF